MITTRRQLLSGAGATAAALTLPRGASAAGDYPNKPIKIIVAAAAGGPTDVPARLASRDPARPKLGQPVGDRDRPGAGGALWRARGRDVDAGWLHLESATPRRLR